MLLRLVMLVRQTYATVHKYVNTLADFFLCNISIIE